MSQQGWVYNNYFKAQDSFLSYEQELGFEQDIIYDYLHSTRILASHHEIEAEQENLLLCELFLHQTYHHFLSAIQDFKRSNVFRQQCLDSIHILLLELRRHYQNIDDGEAKYLRLKYKLQLIQ